MRAGGEICKNFLLVKIGCMVLLHTILICDLEEALAVNQHHDAIT